ncbi:MAG: hypothetical protein WC058_04280, partial [Phycisphaeraceae bacterium]
MNAIDNIYRAAVLDVRDRHDLAAAKGDGRWQPRTPAMAAGLADHVWSLTDDDTEQSESPDHRRHQPSDTPNQAPKRRNAQKIEVIVIRMAVYHAFPCHSIALPYRLFPSRSLCHASRPVDRTGPGS